MKKIRKFIIGLLVSLVLVATGCSSSESSTKPPESNVSTQNESNTSAESNGIPENYPDETITVIVGYNPGGGTDTNAREMIRTLNENNIVDQNFQVLNLPGPSGVNGYIKMLQEPDNIYQLMDVSDIGIPLYNGALDATLDDFKPIAQVANGTLVLMVGKDSPYNEVEEIFEVLKEDPGKLMISVSGALDSSEPYSWYNIYERLVGEGAQLESLNFIPFDGTAESVTAVLGGHVDAALVNPGNAIDHVKAGNAKVLVALSDKRLSLFPDVPTLKEKGIDFSYNRTRSWWIGGKVPDEIVKFWEAKLKEATETDTWKEYAERTMQEIDFMGTEEYLEFLRVEGPIFGDYIKMVQSLR